MNVLIVEDDDDKANDLQRFVVSQYDCVVLIERSLQSGLRAIMRDRIDLLLLDMTMRNFDRSLEDDGGRPHHFAGREILRQMMREEIHLPVIIVTHFERFGEEADEVTLTELKEELQVRFPDYLGTVHYRSNVDEWQQQLSQLIASCVPMRQKC